MKGTFQKLNIVGNLRVSASSQACRAITSQWHTFLAIAGCLVFLPFFNQAQAAADLNEGANIERDTENQIWRLKWWSQGARTYFFQHSEDLLTWNWMHMIVSGDNTEREIGFSTNAEKFFMRLVYTDQPTSDPENADFDNDSVSNLDELMQGTDPFSNIDSDNDGLPDDYEHFYFGTLDYDQNSDPDEDGLVNSYEYHIGSYPNNAFSSGSETSDGQFDFNGNGVPASEDAIVKFWRRWHWEAEIGWVEDLWTITNGVSEWESQDWPPLEYPAIAFEADYLRKRAEYYFEAITPDGLPWAFSYFIRRVDSDMNESHEKQIQSVTGKSQTFNESHLREASSGFSDLSDRTTLLLPVELVDTKDGVLDDQLPAGTTITAAMRDVNIEPKAAVEEKKERSIAWIEPHGEDNGSNGPDMPQLALRFRGAEQMGLKIKWKLEVIYDRPRGTNPNEAQITAQDEVFIPKKASGTQPWKEEVLDGAVEFFNHADWIAALQEKGFFGGDAKLTYQLLKADGSALGTESSMLFSIGGKNPEDNLVKDYIDAQATAADARLTRLSYAVGRHESKGYNGGDSRYNQFWEGYARRYQVDHRRGDPLWCKSPKEKSAGGFGIFQITGNLSSQFSIIPREQMWNWQKNADAYVTIVKTGGTAAKGSVMDRFIAAVASTYPSDNEAQTAPTNYAYDGGNYDTWEMGSITLYNGAGGCPQSKLKNPAGKWTTLTNPWKYDPSRATGSRWRYNPNSNNYLHEVIEER